MSLNRPTSGSPSNAAATPAAREFFEDLLRMTGHRESSDAEDLVEVGVQIEDAHPALGPALREVLPDLLRRLSPSQLMPWLTEAATVSKGPDPAHAEPYLRAETSRSTQRLSSLELSADLESCVDVLRYFAEAMFGRPIDVRREERESTWLDHDPDHEVAKTLDLHTIELPRLISAYPDRALNRLAYRLVVLHQLTLHRSGAFSLSRQDVTEILARRTAHRDHGPTVRDQQLPIERLAQHSGQPAAALEIFRRLEHARADAHLAHVYPGYSRDLGVLARAELERRDALIEDQPLHVQLALWPLLLHLGEAVASGPAGELAAQARSGSSAADIAELVLDAVDAVSADDLELVGANEPSVTLPWQGSFDPVALQGHVAALELSRQLFDEVEPFLDESVADELRVRIEMDELGAIQIMDGDLSALSGLMQLDHDLDTEVTERLDQDGPPDDETLEAVQESLERLTAPRIDRTQDRVYLYPEWDLDLADYRNDWCRLVERKLDDKGGDFAQQTRERHAERLAQIRHQFERLRPEAYERIRGLVDGDELDLDRAIEARCDRKAGASPSDRLYQQKFRQQRSVAAVFLVDLSASTDTDASDDLDETSVPQPPSDGYPGYEFVDILDQTSWSGALEEQAPRRRVIDIEKEAIVLMADALQTLGDRYGVYGFSGYGRKAVDFYVAKELDEEWSAVIEGRVAAMEPKQSTRMGPAIRHAVHKLERQPEKLKALIIISDGYPQDFDYGSERGDRRYGLKDTQKALSEAQRRGVHTFCITVDPAGHDYLRDMCPDRRYLVIDETAALPGVLPKVYRGITA